ncbi:MAG: radical SAM protein [Tissierellia bacterium]|nr:radical SAM protein [Tissierellia bacterium]
MTDIYSPYGQYYYVPMTQGGAIPVPVTVGCSWNRCLYCDLNHGNAFRVLSEERIRESLAQLKNRYSHLRIPPKKALMMGGNPFCLSTERLLSIAEEIRMAFPQVCSISAFARSDDILRKSREELLALRAAGMNELSIGVESGSDAVLEYHDKGETALQQIQAMQLLEETGFNYSTYIMLGLGGRALSQEHAIQTGRLLSVVKPNVIIVVTLVAFSNAPLVERIRSKDFLRLSPRESVQEQIRMLEEIEGSQSIYNATHKTNALLIKGKLPEQKAQLLSKMREFLETHSDRQLLAAERRKWTRWDKE